MLEKRFKIVAPQLFAVNGGADGTVTVPDTSLFKVKQQVIVVAASLVNQDQLEVKNVISPTQMLLGLRTTNIFTGLDLSAYTTALGAFVFANEQKRPVITADDFERASFEEEPVVAKRVVMVDKWGDKYDEDNPLPVDAKLDSVQLLDKPYDSGTELNPTTVQQIFTTFIGGVSGTPVQRVTLNFVDATREAMVNWQREYWNGSIWVVG